MVSIIRKSRSSDNKVKLLSETKVLILLVVSKAVISAAKGRIAMKPSSFVL